jgi:hypothetical protein
MQEFSVPAFKLSRLELCLTRESSGVKREQQRRTEVGSQKSVRRSQHSQQKWSGCSPDEKSLTRTKSARFGGGFSGQLPENCSRNSLAVFAFHTLSKFSLLAPASCRTSKHNLFSNKSLATGLREITGNF